MRSPSESKRILGTIRTRLVRSAGRHPFVSGLGALALLSLLFLLFPELDIVTSLAFYDASSGFLHERFAVVRTIRDIGQALVWVFILALIAPLALRLLFFPALPLLVRPRVSLFVLASLALGPGLIVNGILKEFWGRARPREILEFGGEAIFSRAWWISDQCLENCSFVAGEASMAFLPLALVFVVRKDFRAATAALTIAFAALASLPRLAMGAHFLSDVLIAWLLTLLVMIVLSRVILKGLPESFDAAAGRAVLFRSRALRRRLAFLRSRCPSHALRNTNGA